VTEPIQPALFAYARRTDPETSHEAAASVENLRASQHAVWALLREIGPSTDEELAEAVRQSPRFLISPSGLRTRRHELVDAGLVHDTGQRKILATGRRAVVWAATSSRPASDPGA